MFISDYRRANTNANAARIKCKYNVFETDEKRTHRYWVAADNNITYVIS